MKSTKLQITGKNFTQMVQEYVQKTYPELKKKPSLGIISQIKNGKYKTKHKSETFLVVENAIQHIKDKYPALIR